MSVSFCTYFDHWYLTRGLALARSLQRHRPGATLFVLCLTDLCYEVIRRLAPRGVQALRLSDLEAADSGLSAARRDRSVLEYYFTCTPALTLHLLEREPAPDALTYVDADLCFFSDPQPLFDEMGDGSIAIVPHRFPPRLHALERHGIFNVGWVTFRRDDRGVACLRTWRDQCLAWCRDRVEAGRFAEQKYLDAWPDRFPGVVVLRNPGANLAPWNVDSHRIAFDGGRVLVDGQPLVFYHAHGLRHGVGSNWESGLDDYGAAMSDDLKTHVYQPYLRALDRERADVDAVLSSARRGESSYTAAALGDLADYDKAWPEREVARLARRATTERLAACEHDRAARLQELARTQDQLATAEADRAARLAEIERLSAQLSESETDRRARVAQVERLSAQLAESEVDRAARLAEMQRLSAQLEESEADRSARLAEIGRLNAQLTESEADRAARLKELERVGAALAATDADRVARLGEIERLDRELTKARADHAAALQQLEPRSDRTDSGS